MNLQANFFHIIFLLWNTLVPALYKLCMRSKTVQFILREFTAMSCYKQKNLITTLWTTLGRVLLEKLSVINKYRAFYITRRFITVFTRTRHWYLSWARWIQSTTSHRITVRCILILSSYLCQRLPNGNFLSGFPNKFCMHFWSLSKNR
jgi:hypothetical protein